MLPNPPDALLKSQPGKKSGAQSPLLLEEASPPPESPSTKAGVGVGRHTQG